MAFETPGAIFEFDASQDVGGDATWTETGALGNETLTFVGGATPTATQISDGTLNLFAHTVGADGQSNVYESSLGGVGQAARRSATFEVWFKPDDLTTANQVIQETGGSGSGTLISLSGDNLEFLANGAGAGSVSTTVATTLTSTDWHQVVGVINNSFDTTANDTLDLYLNGVLVDSSPVAVNINDWAGGNQGGLGSFGGASHPADSQIGSNNGGVDFSGGIHLYRYYDSALTAGEILDNFNAVTNAAPEWAVDASGAWGTASNWSSDPAIPGVGGNAGGDAILGPAISGPTTVTLDVNADLGGLLLNDADGYTVAAGGGTLTLSGGAEVRVQSGSHEIAAPIAGSAGLLKTQGGSLTLSGTNTFTGTVDINGGTISVGADSNLGNAANGIELSGQGALEITGTTFNTLARDITLAGAGTLDVADAANTVDVTGTLTGTAELLKQGEGSAKLSNAAGFDGRLNVNGGVLVVDSADGLGSTVGETQVGFFDGTVEIDGSGGALTIAEEFNVLDARFAGQTDAHIRNTAGNNTLTGDIIGGGDAFGNSRLANSADGSTLTIDSTLSYAGAGSAHTFEFSGTGNFQIGNSSTPDSGKIVGDGVNVVVALDDPTDTVTVSTAAASTDTSTATGSYWGGNTTIQSGTLVVEQDGLLNNGELISDTINVQAGATFDVSDFTSYSLQATDAGPDATFFTSDDLGQTVSGAGTIIAQTLVAFEDSVFAPGDSTGTLNVNGNLQFNLTQENLNGGWNFELGSTTTTGGGVNDLIAVSGAAQIFADGAAGGSQVNLAVTPVDGQLAAGTYTLLTGSTAGSTATSADFTVSVVSEQGNVLNTRQDDASTVSINPGSVTVSFSAAETAAWTGSSGDVWDVGSAGNWSTSDNLFFDLDDVTFGDGTGQTTVNIAEVVTPGSVTFNNTVDTYTITGSSIQGSGDITLNAGANVVLANQVNFISGTFNVGAGASLTIGDGATAGLNVINVDSTFDVAAGGELAFDNPAGETLNGTVSGAGGVRVEQGTVTVGGANTYTGATVINGGALVINNTETGTPLGTTASGTTVNSGGALRANGETSTIAEAITLNGGTLVAGGGAASAVTFSSDVSITGSGSAISAEGDTGADGLTIDANVVGSNGSALTVNAGNNATVNVTGSISNNGNLTKIGGGTLALTSASSSIAAPTIDVQGGDIDVTATSSGLALSGQTLTGAGAVTGNVSTASSSTIRVGGVAGGTASVSTGLQLDYNAALDTPGDGVWTDSESNPGDVDLNFVNGSATPVAINDPTFIGVTAAYDAAATGGALSPGASNGYFDFRGQSSGTFEVVFNVTDTAAGDEQVLIDIGGGAGVALVLNDDVLTAGVNGAATDTTNFSTTLSTGLHHAVIVIGDTDPAGGSDDTFALYVNDVLIGSSSTVNIDDYSGANGWSFGGPNSVTLDPTQTAAGAATLAAAQPFHGEVAIARFYQTAFDASDVSTNFAALQSTPFVDVDTFTVDGDLTLDSSATLELDIFDAVVGSDLLEVTGQLTAAGVLDISVAGDVLLGEIYDILDFTSITGAFDAINLPALAGGLTFDTSQLLIDGTLEVVEATGLDGDYNGDLIVSAADYSVYRSLVGTASSLPNDPIGGTIDGDQFDQWAANFGASSSPALGVTAAVPEPTALLSLLTGSALIAMRRRR